MSAFVFHCVSEVDLFAVLDAEWPKDERDDALDDFINKWQQLFNAKGSRSAFRMRSIATSILNWKSAAAFCTESREDARVTPVLKEGTGPFHIGVQAMMGQSVAPNVYASAAASSPVRA